MLTVLGAGDRVYWVCLQCPQHHPAPHRHTWHEQRSEGQLTNDGCEGAAPQGKCTNTAATKHTQRMGGAVL